MSGGARLVDWTRHRSALAAIAAVMGLLLSPPAAVSSDFPDRVYAKKGWAKHEMWVTADSLESLEQGVELGFLTEQDVRGLRSFSEDLIEEVRKRGQSPMRCPLLRGGSSWGSAPEALEDLVRTDTTVVVGELVRIAGGFFFGSPSTLLGIEVERSIGLLSEAMPEFVLVVQLDARFSVGELPFCSSGSWPQLIPKVGDRLVVFLDDHTWNDDGDFFRVQDGGLFVHDIDGHLFFKRNLRKDPWARRWKTADDVFETASWLLD